MSYKEDANKFEEWFDNFVTDNGGGYKPNDNWFNNVQKAHKNLREFLGGDKKTMLVDLKANQKAADEAKVKPLIEDLFKTWPSLDSFVHDKNDLLRPIINVDGKGIKTGKAIMRWADDYLIDKDTKNKLNNIISKLGSGWAHAKSVECQLTVMLSTTAKAFCLLGHLGPDEESCFAAGGCNDDHKFVLGQTENTFVLLVKENGKNIARFWGFATPDRKIFTLSNMYLAAGASEGSIFEAIRHFFGGLLRVDVSKIKEYNDIAKIGEGIYFNGDTWSFTTLTNPKKIKLVPNQEGISNDVQCPHCNESWDADEINFEEVDGINVCYNCYDDANYCDYSDSKTLEEIVTFVDKTGHQLYVKESLIKKEGWKKCSICDHHCEKPYEFNARKRYCQSCVFDNKHEIDEHKKKKKKLTAA
jgi:hypothetical protein